MANRRRFGGLFEFRLSATDMIIQGVLALAVPIAGFAQQVPVAFLIPATILSLAGVAWLLREIRTGGVIGVRLEGQELQPLPGDATLPRATSEELAGDVIANRALFISDVPRDRLYWMVIRGKTFKDCQIFGPAVVGLIGGSVVRHVSVGVQQDFPMENAIIPGVRQSAPLGHYSARPMQR